VRPGMIFDNLLMVVAAGPSEPGGWQSHLTPIHALAFVAFRSAKVARGEELWVHEMHRKM
jgi:hypothetical protein